MAWVPHYLKRVFKQARAPVIGLAITGYGLSHLINGDRGIAAWLQLAAEVETANQRLVEIRTEREALEARTSLLRSDNLDLDMLDEQARVILNYAHPNDRVLILD